MYSALHLEIGDESIEENQVSLLFSHIWLDLQTTLNRGRACVCNLLSVEPLPLFQSGPMTLTVPKFSQRYPRPDEPTHPVTEPTLLAIP